MIGRRTRLLATVLLAAVFFVGCSGEQEESGKQETSSEVSTATTTETTVDETTAETTAGATGEEASSLAQEGRSPEEVLALQYEYINR